MRDKKCEVCHVDLPTNCGNRRKYCTACAKDRNRKSRRASYLRNRESILRQALVYGAAHKEQKREYDRQYRERNRESIKAKRQEYYRKNSVEILRRRALDRDQKREYNSRYRREKPEAKRNSERRRRARKAGVETAMYAKQQIWDHHQGLCYLCHQPCDKEKGSGYNEWFGTVDHVHPIALGGPDSPRNVALCCLGCNLHKGKRVLAELDPGWHRERLRPSRQGAGAELV